MHLSGQHNCVIGLAKVAVQHALDEVGAVAQRDEHQCLPLGPQSG